MHIYIYVHTHIYTYIHTLTREELYHNLHKTAQNEEKYPHIVMLSGVHKISIGWWLATWGQYNDRISTHTPVCTRTHTQTHKFSYAGRWINI